MAYPPPPFTQIYPQDSGSAAITVGTAVCTVAGKATGTVMTTAALAAGGQYCGVMIAGWGPSPAGIQVQQTGILDPSVLSLGAGAAGNVGVSAAGVVQRWVSGVVIGTCDLSGSVSLNLITVSDAPELGAGSFGDGSDGNIIWDGTTTLLGLAPSTNVYTLTRDIFLGASTVNAGVTIKTAGFRVFCNSILTILATGVIHNGGAAASAASAGTGGTGGTGAAAGSIGGGTNGGTGSSGSGAGGASNNQTANRGMPGQTAGNGGAGGTDGTHAGVAGGTWSAYATSYGSPRALPWVATGLMTTLAGTTTAMLGGAGGGAAGGDNADAGGGGGGGGGGVCLVAAFALANAGTIHANGGAGSAGVSAANNAGGGGGGAGGVVLASYRYLSGAGTFTATGGAPGAKAGASAAVGIVGSAGTVVQVLS